MSASLVPALFTQDALFAIQERLDATANPNDFMAEVDAIASSAENVLPAPMMSAFDSSLLHADDGQNARSVYETLGPIDRANAADPRLWSYLSLVTQRDYMAARWSLDPAKNWRARVQDRWLMTKPTRRALVRNGISRLWWISELTSDPRLERAKSAASADPYFYTRWVFELEDRIPAIFERELGAKPTVMWALIEALQDSRAGNQGAEVREVAKELRVQSGFRSLERLDPDEVVTLVSQMLSTRQNTEGQSMVLA